MTRQDPLAELVDLPGVAEATQSARESIDKLLWHKGIRARKAEFVAESALRGAVATCEMEGAGARLEAVRSGAAVDASPVGRVLAGALRLSAEIPQLTPMMDRAPRQALARMHALVAAGMVPDGVLGRPRLGGEPVDDPLNLGSAPSADEAAQRLDMLCSLLAAKTSAPAIVVASLAHGELAALRPFGWGSGLVARAMPRLLLASRGVDPGRLSIPEGGLMTKGRPRYVQALRGYMSGTTEGVAQWLVYSADAVQLGAEATAGLAEAVGETGLA